MKMELNTKQPTPKEFIILEKGKRSRIHPNLKTIDNFDCNIEYNVIYKYFVVDYRREDSGYTKTLITCDVSSILETLFEK